MMSSQWTWDCGEQHGETITKGEDESKNVIKSRTPGTGRRKTMDQAVSNSKEKVEQIGTKKKLKSAKQEEQDSPVVEERAGARKKEQDSKTIIIKGRDEWKRIGLHKMNNESKTKMKGTKPKGSRGRVGTNPGKGELVKAKLIKDYFNSINFQNNHTNKDGNLTTEDSQGSRMEEPGPQTKKS